MVPSSPPQKPQVPLTPFDGKKTLSEVGQWDLIKAILPYTTPVPGGPLATMDDVMHFPMIRDAGGKQLFCNIDTFVQSTDMPPQMTPYQAGWKAVTGAISDLGAKGIRPIGLVVSLCLPQYMRANDALNLVQGISAATERYGCGYFGGDLNEAREIVITPTVIGMADPNIVIGRGGAHPGDILCVSDYLGRTAAGLEILLQGKASPLTCRAKLETAVFLPETPLEQGIAIAEQNFASASIDSSDGIAFSAAQLAAESKCGIEIWDESLPIAQEVVEYASEFNRQEDLALYGGEEYCYLWTMPKNKLSRAKTMCKQRGWLLFEIGKVTQDSAIVLKSKNGIALPLRTQGFTHFANKAQSP